MLGSSHNDADYVGGYQGSQLSTHYSFNGSAWSTKNSMSNSRYVQQQIGTTSDAMTTGGSRHANNDSEVFDGTSWASGPTNTIDKYSPSSTIDCGGTAAGVVFGGGTGTAYGDASTQIMHFDR